MYNLLVGPDAEDQLDLTIEWPLSRFLEYTADAPREQLRSLSTEAKRCLMSWPCLLMREGRGDEIAHLAQIERLEVVGSEIRTFLRLFPSQPELTNDAVWRSRGQLDIEQFEFSRFHWAIKDRDLPAALASAGISFDPTILTRFANLRLPAPSRPELIAAGRIVGNWGHTEIDDLLLEAGVDGLSAGRDLGSRRDRATAIVQYVLEHPSATTAENALLSSFVVRAASPGHVEPLDEGSRPPASAGPSTRISDDTPVAGSTTRSPNRVFVVHGRDDVARNAVVAYLRTLGLEAIVLHEQANMGRHLLTKLIDEAELVTFAVVLMTGDDVGGATASALRPRARQNVILELGYFLSHLGQARVCALISPELETPSDFDGIVYITMSSNDQWKRELKRELIAAELPVDAP